MPSGVVDRQVVSGCQNRRRAGFGYGDDDDRTVLRDMQGNYTTVYLRHTFEIEAEEIEKLQELGLAIHYDDAFIAYLNGHEILRVGVEKGRGQAARGIKSHEAKRPEYFRLNEDVVEYLLPEDNVLAIEGHNSSKSSSDFTLDPYLILVKEKE